MNRQLSLTPTEAEKFTALAVGGSMWIMRAGTFRPSTRPGGMGGIYEPPVEFAQACAPCETCGGSHCVVPPDCDCDRVTSLNFALCNHPPADCTICHIQLAWPCPRCEGTGNELLTMYRRCSDCHGMMTATLGYAYAVGEPLPIIDGDIAHDSYPEGDLLFVATFQDGSVHVVQDSDYLNESTTDRFTHYDLATLPGQWAIEVRKA